MDKVLQNKLDLTFYKGEDLYSDGDIEDVLLDIVKTNDDYYEILSNDNRWPILYHLSPERENIIEPLNISREDDVLEIGAGCGSVTGAIARKCKNVDCIELSKRRSSINAYKNKKYDNIKIYVGNFEDIKITKKYDVITLIGVFEYAKYYINTKSPYDDFLIQIKSMLKPGGRLYIAIENKLGLKYFAGSAEDHSGKYFESISGYTKKSHAYTFSYNEMKRILDKNGFKDTYFYYPMPDYKLPTQIFSDDIMPTAGDIKNMCYNFDRDRLNLFNEELAFANIIDSGEFKIFANSFLIETVGG